MHHPIADDPPGNSSPLFFWSCTLLTLSQDCHNRIVRVLDEIPRSDVLENEACNDDDDETVARPFRMRPAAPLLRPGLTPAMRALNQDTPAPEPPKLPELSPALKIPVTSLRTPPELARQRLLIYDRYSSSLLFPRHLDLPTDIRS
jgi:hypothetical protein